MNRPKAGVRNRFPSEQPRAGTGAEQAIRGDLAAFIEAFQPPTPEPRISSEDHANTLAVLRLFHRHDPDGCVARLAQGGFECVVNLARKLTAVRRAETAELMLVEAVDE